jgi:copper homeostasis protein
MNRRVMVEICVGDVESAIAAAAGGADRVELCADLAVGGTTPSTGTIAITSHHLSIPVHVLIRPRGGDFVYSEAELAVIRRDIGTAKAIGAAGVVFGVLRRDATIDREQTAALVALSRPLRVTFHKAFDQTHDPEEALDVLMELGVDRVLSSGGRPTALEGITMLAKLVERARNRIAVMAGGRLNVDSLGRVVLQSGINEIHIGSAASRTVVGATPALPRDGSETSWERADARRVAAIVALARGL